MQYVCASCVKYGTQVCSRQLNVRNLFNTFTKEIKYKKTIRMYLEVSNNNINYYNEKEKRIN